MSEEVTAPTTEQAEATSNLSLLASQHFGSDFHGEVVEPEKPEGEENVEDVEEAPEVEEVEQSYEISHIAQLLGVDESQLDVSDEGKIVLAGKVDGESVKTSAADLLSNHQMYTAADKRLADAKEKASKIAEEVSAKAEQVNHQYVAAGEIINQAEALLNKDYEKIDWDELKTLDPAEYSAKKIEYSERREEINKMRQEAVTNYEQVKAQQEQEAQAQFQEYLVEEQKALLTKLPECANEAKATEEKSQIADYLLREGFSEGDIGNASDHRLIVMDRKAMLYDQGKANTNAKEKKIVKIPKVMKPGAPKSQGEQHKATIAKLEAKAKASGSEKDALALIKARRAS